MRKPLKGALGTIDVNNVCTSMCRRCLHAQCSLQQCSWKITAILDAILDLWRNFRDQRGCRELSVGLHVCYSTHIRVVVGLLKIQLVASYLKHTCRPTTNASWKMAATLNAISDSWKSTRGIVRRLSVCYSTHVTGPIRKKFRLLLKMSTIYLMLFGYSYI